RPWATQHARHDPHALEGFAVRLHRRLEPGAAGNVRETLPAHRPLGRALERRRVLRNAGPVAAQPTEVDVALTLPAVSGRGHARDSTPHRFTVTSMKVRAAVLEQFGAQLEVQELDLAEPQAGEALVRLVACGVCHTDLYTAS